MRKPGGACVDETIHVKRCGEFVERGCARVERGGVCVRGDACGRGDACDYDAVDVDEAEHVEPAVHVAARLCVWTMRCM